MTIKRHVYGWLPALAVLLALTFFAVQGSSFAAAEDDEDSDNANLNSMSVNVGRSDLEPDFDPEITEYKVRLYGPTLGWIVHYLKVSPADDNATVTVNGQPLDDGYGVVKTPGTSRDLPATGLVVVTAADGVTTKTYTVSFVDQAPNRMPDVVEPFDDLTLVHESATHPVSLKKVFSDMDGDDLTVKAVTSNDKVATVSVAEDQESLIVSAQGRGTATITATALDESGATASDSFEVTVKSALIIINPLRDIENAQIGQTLEIPLKDLASDADGDAIVLADIANSPGVSIVESNNDKIVLRAERLGEAFVQVFMEDSDRNWVADDFTVTVVDLHPGPVVNLTLTATDSLTVNADSITATWQPPVSGRTPQSYVVRLNSQDFGPPLPEIETSEHSATFTGLDLEPGKTYRVSVFAVTPKTIGETTEATITVSALGGIVPKPTT